MSSFPLFHFTHAFHPHHRYLTTSHPDFPITSLSSGVCPPSFPHLRTCLPSLSPHFRHLLNSPNPTHSGIVDDHDSQAHLGDILPPRLTVCLLNMSSHRIMLLHSENENFHKRHRILLFEIFSSKLWDFFCIEKFDFF